MSRIAHKVSERLTALYSKIGWQLYINFIVSKINFVFRNASYELVSESAGIGTSLRIVL